MTQKILHTIGYEGSSISDFLTTLSHAGINLLIDVRDVPLSRKSGFSKTALSGWLDKYDIEYLHLKGLGDPKPGRIAAREGRYDDFQRIFGTHLKTVVAQTDMLRGLEAASEKIACLLCFERDHTHCHRHIVGKEMARRSGFQLVHLKVQSDLKTNLIKRREPRNDGAFAHIG